MRGPACDLCVFCLRRQEACHVLCQHVSLIFWQQHEGEEPKAGRLMPVGGGTAPVL